MSGRHTGGVRGPMTRTGWRWRLGSAILAMVGGAVIGWALSLTQGPQARHWPWVAVGGLAALAVGLISVELIAHRRCHVDKEPVPDDSTQPKGVIIFARQMRNNGAIVGPSIDVTSDDFTNSGIVLANPNNADPQARRE
jgi:hypothetical protein